MTGIITRLAGAIITALVILVPSAYFFLAYQYMSGSLEAESEINGQIITKIIIDNPEMWQYEQTRLKEYLARRPRKGYAETRRVLNAVDVLIAEYADDVQPPMLSRSFQLFDAGIMVGRLEISRSMRPMLKQTGSIFLLMLLMGGGAFYILRTIPIQALRRSEDAIRKERDTAQKYLDVAEVMLVALDADQRVVMINRKGCETLESREQDVLGRNWFDSFVPDRNRAAAKAEFVLLLTEPGHRTGDYFESPVLTGSGRERAIVWRNILITDGSGKRVGTLSSGEDITERKHLEDQLRHALKMEAVGLLAGGIAHDFNNILAAIMGYAGLIQMDQHKDAQLNQHVEQIIAASDRAARLVKNLLAFSRKQIIDPKPVQVNDIVTDVAMLLTRLLREDIEMRVDLSHEPLMIRADSGQIEQVLMNLATNARDAMPGGGWFQIKTSRACMDRDYVAEHGYGEVGEYACIAVSDTGSGMTAQVLEKIFDPFFTTKEVGKGTGLGMSVAYGIIKQHDGFINAYSEPGIGSTFRIYLPLTASSVATSAAEDARPPSRGAETVLLAEDDVIVRNMLRSVLESAGYTVIEARDGRAAVDAFLREGDRIQLVLLDVIMPRMNGRVVYDEIRSRRPDCKIIFMSGYTAEFMEQEMLLAPDMHFIGKPISPKELLGKVREVLDA